MQFELNEAQIDEILFVMEDQNSNFIFDTESGEIINLDEQIFTDKSENTRGDRYIDLPDWDSSEGFLLMEHFAASLKNPIIQNKLRAALDRGKGVFRAFKDVLAEYPEAEQLWYSFKEREMRKVVLDWYNAMRETWGLEKIGLEPEDTDDLIFEDFKFETWTEAGAFGLYAETEAGEKVGQISGSISEGPKKSISITELRVEDMYQGLGVGKSLLSRFLENYAKEASVQIDLPVSSVGFSRALEREGFSALSTRFIR
ncbi:MAG: GNAT family N-acetyltransferase [Spirochaetaceae bacterium]|jgi:GNAT superfamily N-acetyltransferase|nr:GNAT family N-acetyltransferase [Spirochaetaceae bacterium]